MRKMITEKDVPIPMRDGLKLSANIYRPEKSGKYPVIMAFTIFGKDEFWSEKHPGWGIEYEPNSPSVTGSMTFEANDPAFWVPNDYVLIIVDPRGYARSPGQRQTSAASILHQGTWARDMYDAIEWAGEQDWSNGNVGLSGVSILGFSQWRVAGLNPPHLKAINPWEALTDSYRDASFPGGIPETGVTSPTGILNRIQPPHNPAWPAPETEDPPAPVEKEEDEFLSDISLPALICATWSSHGMHTRGSFRAFRKISSKYKFLYVHGRQEWATFYTAEARTIRKMFFDHFLKGTDNRILDMPPIRMEVRETIDKYTVRHETAFPLPQTQYRKLYLDATDRRLTFEKNSQESKVSYDSADGKVTFDFTFEQDTELIGYMSLKLCVSPEDGDDMDIFVTVRKFNGHGDEVFFECTASPEGKGTVALGWLRLSHRELDSEKSTPWEPYPKHVVGPGEKVKPGDIVPCEIPILPSGTLFRKGETLKLEISGKYRGGDGEKVFLYYEHNDTVNQGAHAIYTGGKFDSYLLIPVAHPR